jgi:hypothetical protein
LDETDLPLTTSDIRACPEATRMRPLILLVIIVSIGWSAPDLAQAEQANSCKQCSDQRHACSGGYSAKTCQVEYERCMKNCQRK